MKRASTKILYQAQKRQRTILVETGLDETPEIMPLDQVQGVCILLQQNLIDSHNNGNIQADLEEFAALQNQFVTPSLVQFAISENARISYETYYRNKNRRSDIVSRLYWGQHCVDMLALEELESDN